MADKSEQAAFDERMMRRALELAARGAGHASPNPMVGAVIVDGRGNIIGEGFHERYGEAHAEINALRSVQQRDLSDATLYVTLEPCSHHGKTPPCADAVAEAGVGRVVTAMRDPNPVVGGRGNKRLREAGITVVVGVLEDEARRLNEAYVRFIRHGLPFVTAKVAQTLDGYIALPNGESQWITGELARERGHLLRAANDAVLVGTNTARRDNPSLTVRHGVRGRNPKRVVLDRRLSLPPDLKLFTDDHRELTIVLTGEAPAESARAHELRDNGITVIGLPTSGGGVKLADVFRVLGEQRIASVLVEGGGRLISAAVRENLVQKGIFFIAPKLFGTGVKTFQDLAVEHLSEAPRLAIHKVEMVGEDVMLTAYL